MYGRPLAALLLVAALLSPAANAADADIYQQAIASPARSESDRARDARDKPADVLAFAGLKPGMTVADIFGGGGYYSELISYVVGPTGKVLLVNNAPYVSFSGKDLKERFKDGRLKEVQRSVVESCNLGLAPGSLDAALIVMSYHDLYTFDPQGWPKIDAAQFLEQIRAALKPGGAFLIVDHSAPAGTGVTLAEKLHRVDEAFAIKDIESHGFRLEKSWDGLRNPSDDRQKLVFDPAVRGQTDRFVHLYRRR